MINNVLVRLGMPILLALLLCTSVQAAEELDQIGALTQPAFRRLSEDMSSVTSYKAVTPAEPLGIVGFDVGVELSSTKLKNSEDWNTASGSNDFSSNLFVPKLHAHLGLPFNIDLGAVYSSIPGSGMSLVGGELRYALIEGGVAMPAVAIRVNATILNGVDQLDFNTQGIDVSVSKGFVMFTPYGGLGYVRSNSEPDAATGLAKETISSEKIFAGFNLNFGLFNFAAEADKTGEALTYSAKFGFRF